MLTYNLSEFDEWLPAEPTRTNGSTGEAPFSMPAHIRAGDRNTTLYRSARSMHAKGWSAAAIVAALQAENLERGDPPLPRDEVDQIATHATQQADRPEFGVDRSAPTPTIGFDPAAPTDAGPFAERFPAFCTRLRDATRPVDLVPGLVPFGITMIHGQPRANKSWCAQEIARATSTGTNAFSLERFAVSTPLTTWYVTEEDPELEFRDRFLCFFAGAGQHHPDTLHVSVQKSLSFDDATWQRWMIEYATDCQVALLIVDPIRASSAAVDQGPRELKPLAAFLRTFKRLSGSGVLLVHHDVKPLAGKPDDRARPQRASGGGIFSVAEAPIHAELIGDTRGANPPQPGVL
jgi:hypothetical protein